MTPSSKNTDVATVSGALTFITSDWPISKTVTVTRKKAGNATVNHTVTGANYGNLPESEIGKVTVTVKELPGVPCKPEGLTAKPGNRQVILTRDHPNDDSIDRWEINCRKVSETLWNTLRRPKLSIMTETVPGLENGSEYVFQIRARNNIGWSPLSDSVKATPRFSGEVKVEPEKLTMREGGTGTYKVRLTESPGEDTVVLVELKINDDKKDKAYIVDPASRRLIFITSDWEDVWTVTITGLSDSDGNNEIVTVEIIGDDPVPTQPRNLTATPGDKKVTLRRDAPDNPSITLWQVSYRKGTESSWPDWENIPASTATTRTHTVMNPKNGTEYHFRSRPKNDAGKGDESEHRGTPVALPPPPILIVPSTVRVMEGSRNEKASPTDTVGPEELSYVMIHLPKRPSGNVTITARSLSRSSNLLVVHEPTKILTLVEWDFNKRSIRIPIYALNDNEIPEDPVKEQLRVSVISGLDYLDTDTVNIEIVDNDIQKLVVSCKDLTIKEDDSASYEVSLSKSRHRG